MFAYAGCGPFAVSLAIPAAIKARSMWGKPAAELRLVTSEWFCNIATKNNASGSFQLRLMNGMAMADMTGALQAGRPSGMPAEIVIALSAVDAEVHAAADAVGDSTRRLLFLYIGVHDEQLDINKVHFYLSRSRIDWPCGLSCLGVCRSRGTAGLRLCVEDAVRNRVAVQVQQEEQLPAVASAFSTVA